MAKKKRKRRPAGRPARPAGPTGGPPPAKEAKPEAPASSARRERKEEARRARQAAIRRYRRARMLRRGLVWGGGALAVGLVAFYFVNQTQGSGKLSEQGQRVAAAAGCTGVESPPSLGGGHAPPYTYSQQPPTSGTHDPSPLDAGVYDSPQDEARMVHSLEHGAVEIYYGASGKNALPKDVVDELSSVADGNSRVIMTPAPQTLSPPLDDSGFTVSLAFAAWDRLLQCPNTIKASQAKTLGRAFIEGFVDASSAPEAGAAI